MESQKQSFLNGICTACAMCETPLKTSWKFCRFVQGNNYTWERPALTRAKTHHQVRNKGVLDITRQNVETVVWMTSGWRGAQLHWTSVVSFDVNHVQVLTFGEHKLFWVLCCERCRTFHGKPKLWRVLNSFLPQRFLTAHLFRALSPSPLNLVATSQI